jgi:hypothetical protein
VVVVLVALGSILLASVTLDPMRTAVWQALGQKCGTVGTGLDGRPVVNSATAQREEACFVSGYVHCRAVTFANAVDFQDGTTTQTFVVEPAVGPLVGCGVVVSASTYFDGGRQLQRMERCKGVLQHPDGLTVLGCGTLGHIVIPIASP